MQNVYSRIIKKYNECGIPVHNTYIDNVAGEAGISKVLKRYWIAQIDIKEEKKDKTKIIVYYINDRGHNGDFIAMAQYAIENKIGCPE